MTPVCHIASTPLNNLKFFAALQNPKQVLITGWIIFHGPLHNSHGETWPQFYVQHQNTTKMFPKQKDETKHGIPAFEETTTFLKKSTILQKKSKETQHTTSTAPFILTSSTLSTTTTKVTNLTTLASITTSKMITSLELMTTAPGNFFQILTKLI